MRSATSPTRATCWWSDQCRGAAGAARARGRGRGAQPGQAAEQQEATQEVIIANDEANDASCWPRTGRGDRGGGQGHQRSEPVRPDLRVRQRVRGRGRALALARAEDTIFQPIAARSSTEDTDLTTPRARTPRPSTASVPDGPLRAGIDLHAGEKSYGVSALYLVAHSNRGVRLGTSAIAPRRQQPSSVTGLTTATRR